MAKIQFGIVATDARRKLGGVVFSKSRFGSYVRRKSSPVQPRTNFQRGVRANFTALSKDFATVITAAQVAGWNSFASLHPVKDRFGNTISLTGLQWFQRLNRNLHTVSVAFISSAPPSLSNTDLGGATLIQAATTPFHLMLSTTNLLTGTEDYVIFGTPPLDTGRTFIGKRFRLIQVSLGTVTQPIDVNAAWKAKFGSAATGQVISMQVVPINLTTGSRGTPYQASVTLTNPV